MSKKYIKLNYLTLKQAGLIKNANSLNKPAKRTAYPSNNRNKLGNKINFKDKHKPAEIFQPGIYLNDELKARGWNAEYFSDKSNLSIEQINLLLNGDNRVTPEIATILSETLGTSAELWLNLQKAWDEREK